MSDKRVGVRVMGTKTPNPGGGGVGMDVMGGSILGAWWSRQVEELA